MDLIFIKSNIGADLLVLVFSFSQKNKVINEKHTEMHEQQLFQVHGKMSYIG